MTTTTAPLPSAPPITLDQAKDAGIGDPVGFARFTIQGPICADGCLAPGSSPHSHAVGVDRWEIYGTTGVLTLDAEGMGVRVSSVHPFGYTYPEAT